MVHYFFGEDTFRAEQALRNLAHEHSARLRWLDRPEVTERPLRNWLAESQGLFGHDFIVVRDPSGLPAAQQEAVVVAIAESKTAWACWDRNPPDKRTKLWRALSGQAREYRYQSGAEVVAQLQQEAASAGGSVNPAAAEMLVARLGYNGYRLRSELARLLLMASPVTVELVNQEIAETIPAEIFACIQAVSTRQVQVALTSVTELLRRGESEFYVLSMLAYQFKTMLKIHDASATGQNTEEVARSTKIHPYVVKKTLPMLTRFTRPQLLTTLTKILATDVAIKDGKVPARTGLLMLVLSLVQA